MSTHFQLVGAGLAGSLLAIVLARRGHRVTLYEKRPDPRTSPPERGRSINLALAARGLRGLELAGVLPGIAPLLIPMRGRCVHEHDGASSLQPYGLHEHEVNWSVSRSALNLVLIETAAAIPGVELRFAADCTGLDIEGNQILMRDAPAVPLGTLIATDGAGSAVRHSLEARGLVLVREEWLDHDYRELSIPASHAAGLEREALHIWPRGSFMLIALPNTDGSFTATLFLPRTGPRSFATLVDARSVEGFFEREFPGARRHLPHLAREFQAHPPGRLGTVYCEPWHVEGRVLLMGDAAHAIVPFHGQGMNCAFEDVVELDSLLARSSSVAAAFEDFSKDRRRETDAIARMALENYAEMREDVLDEGYLRRKALAAQLERAFPDQFIPRYSMVMFHAGIGYAQAEARGAVQARLLEELDARSLRGEPASREELRALIDARLPRLDPVSPAARA